MLMPVEGECLSLFGHFLGCLAAAWCGRQSWVADAGGHRLKLALAGGGGGYAEFFEFGARAALFFGAGVALDDFA